MSEKPRNPQRQETGHTKYAIGFQRDIRGVA